MMDSGDKNSQNMEFDEVKEDEPNEERLFGVFQSAHNSFLGIGEDLTKIARESKLLIQKINSLNDEIGKKNKENDNLKSELTAIHLQYKEEIVDLRHSLSVKDSFIEKLNCEISFQKDKIDGLNRRIDELLQFNAHLKAQQQYNRKKNPENVDSPSQIISSKQKNNSKISESTNDTEAKKGSHENSEKPYIKNKSKVHKDNKPERKPEKISNFNESFFDPMEKFSFEENSIKIDGPVAKKRKHEEAFGNHSHEMIQMPKIEKKRWIKDNKQCQKKITEFRKEDPIIPQKSINASNLEEINPSDKNTLDCLIQIMDDNIPSNSEKKPPIKRKDDKKNKKKLPSFIKSDNPPKKKSSKEENKEKEKIFEKQAQNSSERIQTRNDNLLDPNKAPKNPQELGSSFKNTDYVIELFTQTTDSYQNDFFGLTMNQKNEDKQKKEKKGNKGVIKNEEAKKQRLFKYACKNKKERQKLVGVKCIECQKYYETFGGELGDKICQECTRHRSNNPLICTPVEYYDINFQK